MPKLRLSTHLNFSSYVCFMGQPLIYIPSYLSWGVCLMPCVLISCGVLCLFLHAHHINPGLIYWKIFHPHFVDWSFLMCFAAVLIMSASGMIHKHWLPLRGAAGGKAVQLLPSEGRIKDEKCLSFNIMVQSEEFGTWDFSKVICSNLGYNSSRGKCPENEDETDPDHLKKILVMCPVQHF